MRARTEEIVAMVDDHVLSQEDQRQIHRLTRPTAQSANCTDHFFTTIFRRLLKI